MRRLPSIQGHPRTPRSSALSQALDRWVEREAERFDVSKSFVIATCLSHVSGINEANYRKEATPRQPATILRMRRRG